MHFRCVDYAVKIRVNPDQKGIDLSVKHSMVSSNVHARAYPRLNFLQNPFDEIGLHLKRLLVFYQFT